MTYSGGAGGSAGIQVPGTAGRGSVVMFGLAIPVLGMAASTVLLVLVASGASSEFRWKEAVIASLAIAAFAVGVFAYGLGVQMPIWPWFIQ